MINFVQVDKKIAVGGEMGFYLLGKDDISYEVVNDKIKIKLAIPNWISEKLLPPEDFAFNGVTCTGMSDFQSKIALFTSESSGTSSGDESLTADKTIEANQNAYNIRNLSYSTVKSTSQEWDADCGLSVGPNASNISYDNLNGDHGSSVAVSKFGFGSGNRIGVKLFAYDDNQSTDFKVIPEGINITNLKTFNNNAEAVAELGIGILYKSSSFINGSPMILVTI